MEPVLDTVSHQLGAIFLCTKTKIHQYIAGKRPLIDTVHINKILFDSISVILDCIQS